MAFPKGIHLLATALLVPGLVGAATVTYTSEVDWTSVVQNVTTRDFEGFAAPGTIAQFNTSSGLTIAGVQFIGVYSETGYSLKIANGSEAQWWLDWDSGSLLASEPDAVVRKMIINLPVDTYAFAMDLATGGINAADLTVRINGGDEYLVTTLSRPNLKFFGATSDTPISTVEILYPTAGIHPFVDNFRTGEVNETSTTEETPEAATLALCATGLLLLARAGGRRNITSLG